MTPAQISEAIAAGSKDALKLCEHLLGIECGGRQIPIVKPEYVLTVALARALAGADWRVTLERSWNSLFEEVVHESALKSLLSQKIATTDFGSFVEGLINRYRGGQTRADIVVSNPDGRPLLICEVKLDMFSHKLILEDVRRIAKFLAAYQEISADQLYGVVVFCSTEGVCSDAAQAPERLEKSFNKLMAKLNPIRHEYPRVHISSGILEAGCDLRNPQPFFEEDDAGPYTAGQRDGYIFAPYIIFLGTNSDAPSYRA